MIKRVVYLEIRLEIASNNIEFNSGDANLKSIIEDIDFEFTPSQDWDNPTIFIKDQTISAFEFVTPKGERYNP